MKLSTFLSKTLNSFNNGKSYSSAGKVGGSPIVHTRKNRNLLQGLFHTEAKTGARLANKAQAAIAQSLGHTNLAGFQRHGFSSVKAVVEAAINRERASGN